MNRNISALRKYVFVAAAAGAVSLAALPFASAKAEAAPVAGRAAAAVVWPQASVKYKFANCTALNKVYKHGVGKSTARDKTSSKYKVTTFKKSTSLYNKVIGYRKGLDRDKDGIACEKR